MYMVASVRASGSGTAVSGKALLPEALGPRVGRSWFFTAFFVLVD